MSQFIESDGTIKEVQPANGHDWSLEEMQEFVGGYIEIVSSRTPGWLIVLDEEGKLRNKPINKIATALYPFGLQDPIVGDVLHCPSSQVK